MFSWFFIQYDMNILVRFKKVYHHCFGRIKRYDRPIDQHCRILITKFASRYGRWQAIATSLHLPGTYYCRDSPAFRRTIPALNQYGK